jgi:hypothetical protein
VRERAEGRHLVVRLVALEHGEGNALPSQGGSDNAPPSEFFGDPEAMEEYRGLICMGPDGDRIVEMDHAVIDQMTATFNKEWVQNLHGGPYPEEVSDLAETLNKRASSQQLNVLMLLLKDEAGGKEYNLINEMSGDTSMHPGRASVKTMNRFPAWSRDQLSAQKKALRPLVVGAGDAERWFLLKAFGEPELVEDFSRRDDADPGRFVKWLARALNNRPAGAGPTAE